MQFFTKLFIGVLLTAILLRILLLVWSLTVPFDINGDQTRYEGWAQIAHIHSFAKTYEHVYPTLIPNNMPPGTLYVMYGAYEVYIVIGKAINIVTNTPPGGNTFVNTTLLHGAMRMPSILADIGIGILLFLLVAHEKGEKRGILAASLVWFNPVVWYNSTLWGQTDALTSFFFLLALFFGYKKRVVFALLAFFCSVYIKLSLLPLLPFFVVFLYFFSGRKFRPLFFGLSIACCVILLATLPIAHNPFVWFLEKWATFAKGETQNITVYAFNFWWAVTCFPTYCTNNIQSYDTLFGIPYSSLAYGLFGLSGVTILFLQVKHQAVYIQKKYCIFLLSLVALCAFLFLPRMHDRYLYPFFPLVAGVIALSDTPRRYTVLFIAFVMLHMGNLLASWYPTRFFSLVFSDMLYSLEYRWVVSIGTVCAALVYVILSRREFLRVQKTPHAKQKK